MQLRWRHRRRRGHRVRALVRPGSERKAPAGCQIVVGNPRDAATFVELVGVTHSNPAKAAEFRAIDLNSALAGLNAARDASVKHFVYVSAALPAPVMKSYIAVRTEVEQRIRESGLNATFLRPWYVLAPGRRWPYLLVPTVLATQNDSADARVRAAAGTSDERTNDRRAGVGSRKSCERNSSAGSSRDSRREAKRLRGFTVWRPRQPARNGAAIVFV
jgi:uncharacterized protein YbjT (DUF2867 family)